MEVDWIDSKCESYRYTNPTGIPHISRLEKDRNKLSCLLCMSHWPRQHMCIMQELKGRRAGSGNEMARALAFSWVEIGSVTSRILVCTTGWLYYWLYYWFCTEYLSHKVCLCLFKVWNASYVIRTSWKNFEFNLFFDWILLCNFDFFLTVIVPRWSYLFI